MYENNFLSKIVIITISFILSGYVINTHAATCGLIPGDFPIYSSSEIKLKKDITINGVTVYDDDYKPKAAIGIDGTVSTGVNLTLPDLDPATFPNNSAATDIKSSVSFTVNSSTAVFYNELKLENKNTTMTFTGGGPFHIDKLETKKENSTINFAAGTYYINELKLKGEDSVINITSEPVILHIGNKFEVDGEDIDINLNGNVDGFIVYLHNNAEFKVKEESLNFTGLIYGPNIHEVKFEKENVTFHGAIIVAGDKIEIKKKDFSLIYTPADQAAVNAISTCGTLYLPSPIAEYRFDACSLSSQVEDSRGDFHGIATATDSSDNFSVVGGRSLDLSTEGSTDWVTLPKALVTGIDDFSLSVWVKTAISTPQQEIFHALGEATNDDELEIYLNYDSSVYVKVRNNSATLNSSQTLTNNIWHHVLVTRDDKKVCLYIDGQQQECENNGVSSGQLSVTHDHSILLGQEQDSLRTTPEEESGFNSSQSFKGFIDELKLYQSILTSSDIATLYANEAAGKNADGSIRTTTLCAGQIDHFELHYSPIALTCSPTDITLKACANADCSQVFTDNVSVDLSPLTGWSANPVNVSTGEQLVTLQHTTPSNVVLNVINSSITPNNPLQCFANNVSDPQCRINFSDTGFIFNVPTLTACKPSADVTIAAVKKSNISEQCVGALTGTQSVNFWSTYSNPNTGTKKVAIIGTPIDTFSPGEAIDLIFDINGEATLTVQYDDAGQVQLDAEHTTSNGLVLTGNDSFVSKPVMLAAYTTDSGADCVSADASCSKFKKAGELFDLKVNAACWTGDADTDFTDNPLTPNFELAGINTGRSLLAPSGGSTGNLAISNFNFSSADNGQHTINQAISEVGVFSFSVFPPNYLGEVLSTMSSPLVGRFYPDHFKVTNSNNGAFGDFACSGFSYSGQNFSYSSNPQLTITAYNAATTPAVTQNYTEDFVKLATNDFSVSSPATDATQLGADNTNLVRLLWAPAAPSLTDNADGSLSFSFGNDSYTYIHESNSQIDAFNNSVDLTFTAITDDDNVQTQGLPTSLQPSGEPIRFGRLAISNAHGSELVPLVLTVQAEYFNGTNWQTNTADQCTALNLASHFQLNNTGSWVVGTSTMIIEAGSTAASLTNNSPIVNGSAVLTLSAPGEDNQGYVDILSQLSSSHSWLLGDYDGDGSYDDNPIGRASFGLFKGSDNIIFRRELY